MPVYRLLYSFLSYFIFPIVLIRLFWRSRKNRSIRQHWQQRLGFITLSPSPRIWLHAVSVGETIAAKPLIESLLLEYPAHRLLITNTTATGYAITARHFGNRVEQLYFPYDLNGAVTRFLSQVKPSLIIIMETEIWPNLLHHSKRLGVPVLVANARLSERSTIGYSKVYPLIKATLGCVSKIACRSNQDIENFKKLGAVSSQLEIVGNIKFDVTAETTNKVSPKLSEHFEGLRKIWVAASTHAGEDEIILNCFSQLKKINKNLILVLVPRHPERFETVFQLCQESGFKTQRRSSKETFEQDCDIILGDSMGEMPYWFASANIVFLGGSFSKTGGHNPLEASIYGTPVVSGPTIFNFNDVYEILCGANISWIEQTHEDLTNRIVDLLEMTDTELSDFNTLAKKTLDIHSGATAKLLTLCKQLTQDDTN